MDELAQRITIDAVIDGGARGADKMGGEWACRRGIENMLDEGWPGVVVAFPGGRGTAGMMMRARSAGVEVIEVASQTGGTL